MKDLSLLADHCKKIIADPEANIKLIKPLLKGVIENHQLTISRELILLAVLKVFKNVIPLYKIRTIEDRVKHKKEYQRLKDYDRVLLNQYGIFVNLVLAERGYENYKCCCEILEGLDHFNLIDKIIVRVVEGTCEDNTEIVNMCCKAITYKFGNDYVGETTAKIINQMMDLRFGAGVMEGLTTIRVLDENYMKSKLLRLENTDEEVQKIDLKKIREKHRSKSVRKEEKERAKEERENRKIAKHKRLEEQKKVYKQLKDNIIRLYIAILKTKRKEFYKYTFIGLSFYKNFIRKDLYEGIYILLNDSLEPMETRLDGITSIVDVYSDMSCDFKNAFNRFYEMIEPFCINDINEDSFCLVLRKLVIDRRQTVDKINGLVHRGLQLCFIFYLPKFFSILMEISKIYRIEFNDFNIIKNGIYNLEENNLEKVCNASFYEYHLLTKTCY
ncbi:Nucleolar complex protein 3 like protein [Astathelohania contejeani]|uniref:Nucleolar complex protein 3 like protein n=1 Tax=Astathelohania contejeani TaxID=164912 RepID=A0ABQ7HZ80_9MICR|nr:Nucleolar complex protein 3 like protein [Thelohania contejeani]